MDILKHIDIGVLILNEDMSIHYTNEYMGLYIKGDICNFNTYIHSEFQEIEKYICTEFKRTKCKMESVCKILHNDIYIWVKIRRVYDDNKYIFILENINEFKLLEIKNNINLTNRTRVLSMQIHDVLTPLNGILGMITLLEDTNLKLEQIDYTSMLKECSVNLLSIINDILDFSKLEIGKIDLDLKCNNLRNIIESVNDVVLSKLIGKDVEYNFIINNNISDYVNIDVHRLKQILLNLLYNAIKFTENGSVFLNVDIIEKDVLKFSIKDTGCGIDDIDREKLFKSFSQINQHTKINEGSGLGLLISKELVHLMGGKIWLEYSELNKGSNFCFTIKVKDCDNIDDNVDDKIDLHLFKGKKILILDDNRENRLGLCNLVSKWGMTPLPYASAIEVLYLIKLKHLQFDIGFIDVVMPEMSGKEFAIKLHKQSEKIYPLIALSSLGNTQIDYNSHFKEQLIKPVKESRLKQACYNLIKKFNRTPTPTPTPTPPTQNINPNILIVEDNVINQKVVEKFLNKLGYSNIDVVDDGKKCLNILKTNAYDLILLDIKMPVLNGELVFEYIYNYYQNKDINCVFMNKKMPYIIAVTAHALNEDRKKYLNMGFDDFIGKPVNIKMLHESMNTFIDSL
jgi:CheY-like chemotaxis protein